jgi:hypothetical protein
LLHKIPPGNPKSKERKKTGIELNIAAYKFSDYVNLFRKGVSVVKNKFSIIHC